MQVTDYASLSQASLEVRTPEGASRQ